MSLGLLLFIVLIVLLLGSAHPTVTSGYGPWPGGVVGIILIVVLVLLITGRL